jgi:Mlc titration factor MtfA (ptsG expression regulator)
MFFGSDAVISLTSTAVITYLNEKLTYFQPFDKTLYYLAQFVVNLETEASKYVGIAKPTTPLIPTLI